MEKSERYMKTEKGWAWMVVVGAFIVNFITAGLTKSMGLFNLQLAKHFDISTSYASTPLIVAYIIYPVLAPFCISVAEQFGIRRVVFIGGLVGTVGLAMSSFLVNMPWVIFFFGVGHGLTCACSYGNSFILIEQYFDRRIALANGLSLAGTSCGQFVIPIVIKYLLETYGFGGSLLIMSGIYFNCCLSGALYRPVARIPLIEQREEIKHLQTKSLLNTSPESTETIDESITSKTDDWTKNRFEPTVLQKSGKMLQPSSNIDDNKKHIFISSTNSFSKSDKTITHLFNLSDDKSMEEKKTFHSREGRYYSDTDASDINLKNYTNSKFTEERLDLDTSLIEYQTEDKELDLILNGQIQDTSKITKQDELPLKEKLKRMFDFSALKRFLCLHFLIYSFVISLGVFNFVIYIPGILTEQGLENYDVVFSMSVIGLGDLIGRLVMGTLGTVLHIARYKLKAVVCFLGGINTLLFFISKHFAGYVVQCFLYGLFTGCYVCLMALVCFDFVDSKSAPKVFSLAYPAGALAIAIGQSFLGSLKDLTGSYIVVCVTCAICNMLGAIFVFLLPVVASFDKKWRCENKNLVKSSKQ